MRKNLSGLFLIVLLLGVLAACGPQQTLTPEETASQFLEAIAGSKEDPTRLEAAYNLLSPDSRATISSEDFASVISTAWADAKITQLSIKSIQDTAVLSSGGTRASIAYSITMTTEDGVTTDVYNALSLVKVDGTWGVVWPPVR